jgi:hypothetical protein
MLEFGPSFWVENTLAQTKMTEFALNQGYV